MFKIEFRDVLAVLALVVVGLALWIDHLKPLADWAKEAVASVVTIVLGYYFTSSPQRNQGVAPSPTGQAPPQTPKPDEPAAPAQ